MNSFCSSQETQENAGLRDELNKEVKINQENEAKIKRLLAQQNQYEKSINYLYTVIEKLEVKSDSDNKAISDLKSQLSETLGQLKRCEKICDDRDKFIQYRESQLLEFENTICDLKARIAYLAKLKKMDHTHTDIPADLTDKSTDELVDIITERAKYLHDKIDRISHVRDTKLHAGQARQRLIMASRQLRIKFLEQLHTEQDNVKHAQESRLMILDERNAIQKEYDEQTEKLKNCQEDLTLFKNQYIDINDRYVGACRERDNLTEELRQAEIKIKHWKDQHTDLFNERINLRTEINILTNTNQELQRNRGAVRNIIEKLINQRQREIAASKIQTQYLRHVLTNTNQELQRNRRTARNIIERLINQRQREIAASRIQTQYLRHQIRNMPPVINAPLQQSDTVWLQLL
jgi:chromosome segregation ATPase